jgi:hypothetical protein
VQDRLLASYDAAVRPSEFLDIDGEEAPPDKIYAAIRIDNLYAVKQAKSMFDVGFRLVQVWFDSRLKYENSDGNVPFLDFSA